MLRTHVVLEVGAEAGLVVASLDGTDEALLLRMNSLDVTRDARFPGSEVRASSERTWVACLQVNSCYVSLHGSHTCEGLATSTPAAGDVIWFEVHLSDVFLAVNLLLEGRVTRGTRERSFAGMHATVDGQTASNGSSVATVGALVLH